MLLHLGCRWLAQELASYSQTRLRTPGLAVSPGNITLLFREIRIIQQRNGSREICDLATIEKTFETYALPEKVWSIIADRQRIPELQRDVLDGEVNPPVLANRWTEISFHLQGMRKRGSLGNQLQRPQLGGAWILPVCRIQ
jgi:hypothetical protein